MKVYEFFRNAPALRKLTEDAEVVIRDFNFNTLAKGGWAGDWALDYMGKEIDALTFEMKEDRVFVDLVEEREA